MATVLEKKPEMPSEMLDAIIKLAADKNGRVMLADHCDWLEKKLRYIAKLGRQLKKHQELMAKGHREA